MDIGIIGAGLIGGTLARALAGTGNSVRIAHSSDPDTLTDFDDDSRIRPMWASSAAKDVDLVVLTIPMKSVDRLSPNLLKTLGSVPIVIDTCNYYPVRDGRIDALDTGTADSEWVTFRLGRPVYKVFNNISAPSLKYKWSADPASRVGLAVAGAESEDKKIVFELVDLLGFDPVDGGTLDQSWRQQPGTPTYCRDLNAVELRDGLAATLPSRIPDYLKARDSLTDMDAAVARTRSRM